MNNEKKLKKLGLFAQNKDLALFDEMQAINDNLKSIADKNIPEVVIPEFPTDLNVSIKNIPTGPAVLPIVETILGALKGKDGKDGLPGKNGLPGKDGANGLNGADGESITGDPGKDGSPDTPEQVRDKLETLTEDERLDMSAIKGIDQIVSDLKGSNKQVRVGWGAHPLVIQNGGVVVDKVTRVINFVGAGINSVVRTASGVVNVTISGISGATVYTETPSGLINGSNVTYTTAHIMTTVYNFAINGQYLHPTSDYSFSGTTITMVAALDSSLSGKPLTITYQ